MANWIYGSMSISGPIKRVWAFLNDGIQEMHNSDETPAPCNFFLNEDGEIDSHEYKGQSMHIRDSNRHFIEFDLEEGFEYDHENGTVDVYMSTEIAWGQDVDVIRKISEYGLRVESFGEEWGMMFAQHFVFEDGKMLKDSYITLTGEDYEANYDEDWEWEDEE